MAQDMKRLTLTAIVLGVLVFLGSILDGQKDAEVWKMLFWVSAAGNVLLAMMADYFRQATRP